MNPFNIVHTYPTDVSDAAAVDVDFDGAGEIQNPHTGTFYMVSASAFYVLIAPDLEGDSEDATVDDFLVPPNVPVIIGVGENMRISLLGTEETDQVVSVARVFIIPS